MQASIPKLPACTESLTIHCLRSPHILIYLFIFKAEISHMSYLIFATACCKENVYVQYFVVIIIIIMEFLFLHL